MHRIARRASLFLGIATSFLLVCLAIPHRWITFQIIVFIILKLKQSKGKNKYADTGCVAALAAAYGLPEDWNVELDPSSPTAAAAADSYYASPDDEPKQLPEIIKEALEEEEEDGDVDDKDVHEGMTYSMHEKWRVIMEARGRAPPGRADLNRSGTQERYGRRRVEADAEWTTGARRELLMRRSEPAEAYKKMDRVDLKALQEAKSLGAWRRRPREVIGTDVGHDELYRRVETFIGMQEEHLRRQQRESERRRILERLHQRSS